MSFIPDHLIQFCQTNSSSIGIKPPSPEEDMYTIAATFILSTLWMLLHV